MDTNEIKCWNLGGKNYGLIWLEENLLGSILKFHVSIDREMAYFMSVSTEKQSIKAPANPQIFSDRQTIFRIASLLRKVTSDFQTIFNPGILLEK